jgi:hypothetical protein
MPVLHHHHAGSIMLSERNTLPGGPSKNRITQVRQFLRPWGIRPTRDSSLWVETWRWAWEVAKSYNTLALPGIPRHRWPLASEIASQYVFLVLLEMGKRLRLPFRAGQHLTPFLQTRLQALGNNKVIPQLSLETKDIQEEVGP